MPNYNRGVLASLLQMPEHRIHFVEPDVGGGFGVRGEFYPENFLVPFAAIKTGRPVKWIADRSEGFLSDDHGRDTTVSATLGFDDDGALLGLTAHFDLNIGAYLSGRSLGAGLGNLQQRRRQQSQHDRDRQDRDRRENDEAAPGRRMTRVLLFQVESHPRPLLQSSCRADL